MQSTSILFIILAGALNAEVRINDRLSVSAFASPEIETTRTIEISVESTISDFRLPFGVQVIPSFTEGLYDMSVDFGDFKLESAEYPSDNFYMRLHYHGIYIERIITCG